MYILIVYFLFVKMWYNDMKYIQYTLKKYEITLKLIHYLIKFIEYEKKKVIKI